MSVHFMHDMNCFLLNVKHSLHDVHVNILYTYLCVLTKIDMIYIQVGIQNGSRNFFVGLALSPF